MKKQKIQKKGKVAFTDSTRQKTYNAEFAAIREFKKQGGVDRHFLLYIFYSDPAQK